MQYKALHSLKDHNQLIVIEADRNMGVTVWDREKYIKQVLSEHLGIGNPVVYRNISPNKIQIQSTQQDLEVNR